MTTFLRTRRRPFSFSISLLIATAFLAGCNQETPMAVQPARPDRRAEERAALHAQQQQQASAAELVKTSDVRTEVLPPSRPNIVLITLDTTRYDVTPLDPKSSNSMPFLAKLAKQGINFESAYTTWDSTPPSHFSMMTGFYGGNGAAPLDTKETAVAYHLKKLGYQTFGVAANGNLSQKSNVYLSAFDRYVCLYDEMMALDPAAKAAAFKDIDAFLDQYYAPKDDFNRVMLYASSARVFDRFERELNRTKGPFFAFLNVIDAHDPYFPDPRQYNAAKEERRWNHAGFESDLRNRTSANDPELQDPSTIKDPVRRAAVTEATKKAWGRTWSTTFDLTDDSLAIYKSRYRAEVRSLDTFLQRVFHAMEKRGVLDSTIVIITADHGESLGEDHLISHSFNNVGDREATLHVPLLIVFPRSFGYPARTIRTPITVAAIAPTIYDLVGVDWNRIASLTLPTNIGRSVVAEIGARTPQYVLTATVPKGTVTPAERARTQTEAEKRLRSLGYIQ
jgi:arylsulfatase A-like enzyme